MRFAAFILLICALAAVPSDGEALLRRGGSGSAVSFTFSYPPQANVTPINPGESSFSLTNAFGTFAWTNHQVIDPGGTPHEQYGMWFVTLTPVGGAAQQLTLPNGLGAMSMAQDQLGTVYIEQGDANWYAYLGWGLTIVGSPEPIFTPPAAGQVPNVSGPFTPSADSMTPITAPAGTLTSVEGVWTWGALDTGTDYFLLLNGASTGFSAHTLTIESNGKAFVNQAHTGSSKVFLGYSFSSTGSPTAGPIPIGISFNPSYYSSHACVAASTTCAPIVSISGLGGANVAGHLIATATVTMSNGGSFAGTYSFFNNPPPGATSAFQLVGNQIQLSRPLVTSDEAIVAGGPQGYFAWPVQNGVTMSAGWFTSNVTVGP